MELPIAFQYEGFGGVLGLIISWFDAWVVPIAVPLLIGVLPAYRRGVPLAAISSIGTGTLKIIP
ncbi:MAG: hypothetical protein WD431_26230 [Cyclobacteriaceae bacterium]